MTLAATNNIELDDEGRPWVAGTRTKVIEIVLDKIAHGWDPDEMCRQHPHLSLAQVHAALSCYYDHKDELNTQIVREVREADELRSDSLGDSVVREKLRKLGRMLLR